MIDDRVSLIDLSESVGAGVQRKLLALAAVRVMELGSEGEMGAAAGARCCDRLIPRNSRRERRS